MHEAVTSFLVRRGQDYWPRVWGARGLRYVWLDYAEQVADPDPAVAVAGDAALRRTRARLDRDL